MISEIQVYLNFKTLNSSLPSKTNFKPLKFIYQRFITKLHSPQKKNILLIIKLALHSQHGIATNDRMICGHWRYCEMTKKSEWQRCEKTSTTYCRSHKMINKNYLAARFCLSTISKWGRLSLWETNLICHLMVRLVRSAPKGGCLNSFYFLATVLNWCKFFYWNY